MDTNQSIQQLVDEAVKTVFEKKEQWAKTTPKERLQYLLELRNISESIATEWSDNCNRLRGATTPETQGVGWMTGFGMFGICLTPLIESYTNLVNTGRLPTPPNIRTYNNQKVVTTYPYKFLDSASAPGVRGEVWLEPGKEVEQGKSLEERHSGVCAVLGAGNFEAPSDILHKLFLENEVVVYKPNPVNESNAPFIKKLLASLIRDGYVQVIQGGFEVGSALVHHPNVDSVFMTGSAASYDKIVWGATAEEQKKNKAANSKIMAKPFEAELGGVSPFIIVPGEWTAAEIKHHAEQAIATRTLNGGHVCCATQVVLVDKGWKQREQFREALKQAAQKVKFQTYYPGTEQKCTRYKSEIENAEKYGESATSLVFAPDYPSDGTLTREEVFGPVLVEVALEGNGDPVAFLKKSVQYANEALYGSLSCSLIVDPKVEAAHKEEVEQAIADLRYGSIGLNIFGGFVNFFPLPWGAHPGHTAQDIQSGQGKIANPFFLSHIQKSVIRTPFNVPLHPKLPDASALKQLYRLSYFYNTPSIPRLLGVLGAVIIGI